jgi:hypothetical protein
MSATGWRTTLADRIDIKCEACRLTQSISIHDLHVVRGVAYIECPGCHYFNYIENLKEHFNG